MRWTGAGAPKARRSFQVGIGINSGEVIAGDAGFNERREYTVVGPQTLFAERLQEATVELNAFVVAAASTCNAVRNLFSFVPLTGHPLPGLKRLVDACIVLGLTKEGAALTMPADAAFTETKVDPKVSVVQPVPTPAGSRRVARITPAPPDAPALPRIELADPAAPLRPRKRADDSAGETAFGLPPAGATRYGYNDDDRPMFPDPPAPPARRAAYEDGQGPPIPLPP